MANIRRKRKVLIAFLVVLILLVVIYIFFNSNILNKDFFDSITDQSLSDDAETPSINTDKTNVTNSTNNPEIPEQPGWNLSCEEVTFLSYQNQLLEDQWSRERGFFSEETQAIYNGYDTPTLEALAAQNDLAALQTLAARNTEAKNYQQATEYYWSAAVVGSITALDELGYLRDTKLEESLGALDNIELLAWIVDSMAVRELRLIRDGSFEDDLIAMMFVVDYLPVLQQRDMRADPDEVFSMARARAADLYAQLEEKRREAGLRQFENGQPDYFHAFEDLVDKYQIGDSERDDFSKAIRRTSDRCR